MQRFFKMGNSSDDKYESLFFTVLCTSLVKKYPNRQLYLEIYKCLKLTCSRLKTAAEILWIRSTTLSGSGGPSLCITMSLYRFSCHLTAGSSDWECIMENYDKNQHIKFIDG